MTRWLLVGAVLAGVGVDADAQRLARQPQDSSNRGRLEQRFRERLASVMRERLGLNDEQMRRLADVNQRLEGERRTIFREEMEIRREMRRALRPDSVAPDATVEALLDRTVRIERRKAELFEAEQKELREFLTPVQRARYVAMQEQLRRQMDEMRERRGAPGAEPGPPAGLKRPRRPG